MMNYRKWFAVTAATSLLATSASSAPSESGWAKITMMKAGIGAPHVRLIMDSALHNPDNCANLDGYIIPGDSPANQQFLSIALTAQTLKYQVMVVVDGCYLDRPNVIGIYIKE